MNARVVARVTIKATATQVFDRLVDLESHFLWNPHLQEIAPVMKLKQGAEYTTSSLLLGVRVHSNITVTQLTPRQRLELINDTGTLQYKVVYQLQKHTIGTTVVCTTTISTDKQAFAFTKPILKLLAQRELQTDLQALKHLVEDS